MRIYMKCFTHFRTTNKKVYALKIKNSDMGEGKGVLERWRTVEVVLL